MAKEDKKIDFESSLKELENIVAKLEDENINLEDSVKSFEKGVNLVKECQKQLQTAELKIKKLLIRSFSSKSSLPICPNMTEHSISLSVLL